MDIASIFGSISMAGITALVGPIVTGVMNYKMRKLELEDQKSKRLHDIEMSKVETDNMIKEISANITLERAKGEVAVELKEADAFSNSIKQDAKPMFLESYMEQLFKSPWTAWMGIIICMMFGFVDWFKAMIRPSLTTYMFWSSSMMTVWIHKQLVEASASPGIEFYQKLFEAIVLSAIYFTISIGGWWFADRRLAKFMEKYLK